MAGRGGGASAQQQQQQQPGIIGQPSRTLTSAPPRPCDGEFLLQLLRKNTTSTPPSSSANFSLDRQLVDPAIAALGPSHPFPHLHSNTLSAAVPVRPDIHQHELPFSEIRFPSPPWPNIHNYYPSLNSPGCAEVPPWNLPFPSMRIDGFDPVSSHYQGPLQAPYDFGRRQQNGNILVTKMEEPNSQRWPPTFGSIACELGNHVGFSNGNCSDSVKQVDVNTTFDSTLSSPRGSKQTRDNTKSHFHHQHQGRGESRDRVKKMNSYVKQDAPFQRSNRKDGVLDSQKEWGRAPGLGPSQRVGQGKRIEKWSERYRDGEEDGPIKRNMDSFPLHNDSTGEEDMLPKKSLEIDLSLGPRSHRGDNVSSTLPVSDHFDRPAPPRGSNLHSAAASDIEQSLASLRGKVAGEKSCRDTRRPDREDGSRGPIYGTDGIRERDILATELIGSLNLRDEFVTKNAGSRYHSSRGKELNKELQLPGKRLRNHRREIECRSDLERHTQYFLSIYESLIPAEDEKVKQKQLLGSLEKLIIKEWPRAQLYLYGSCANSFGVSNSDIDICLEINDDDLSKSEILLRLADILLSGKLENVQALTRARVPIVKLMDPAMGISCDICINNSLAVVNTKLLRDYAEIDIRLRQLAFIIKHWAKSRGVNETYRGTLSSYAYVLMCIHFLQQRKPAILPCLQGMEATYVVTVDEIECAYFDKVEKLHDFGAQNTETVGQLLWSFFDYWAYRHDYTNSVISVRTGSFISKRAKDWTRRIGNDRHLICIEDPFETCHDLGRVVDKYSIRTLREEFERAADILTYDPNPSVTLFEPYVPS